MQSRFISYLRTDAPRSRKLLVLIFLLAFIVRLAFVFYFGRPPFKDNIWNDAVGWNLAQGHGFTASPGPPYVPGIYRTPGHPALLAVTYFIFGHSYRAAYVAQSLVDCFTALLIVGIAGRLFDRGLGHLTGILYAVYPYAAVFCAIMTQDILLTFAVTATLYLLIRALEQPARMRNWVAVGVMLGLAALVKPYLCLFGAVIVISVLTKRMSWSLRLRAIAIPAVLSFLVIVPWGIRNYVVFHAFPPLSVSGTGSGMGVVIEEIEKGDAEMMARQEPLYSKPNNVYLRDFSDGPELVEREKQLIRENGPRLRELRRPHLILSLKHLPRLWVTLLAIWNRPIVGYMGMLVSILLLGFGCFGMWKGRKQWRRLMPLYATIFVITVIYAPMTVEARYTLPARPAMVIFAAVAVASFLHREPTGMASDHDSCRELTTV